MSVQQRLGRHHAPRVVVVGAGIGGLSAAALLAHQGLDVTVLERAATPGGKMRQVAPGTRPMDAGPTVLTMRWVFDALFERLGESFERALALSPHGASGLQRCALLARHAWGPDEQLDLSADLERSVADIAAFSGAAQAQRYRDFCARAAQVFRTLDHTFMRRERPTPLSLTGRVLREQGLPGLRALLNIAPFRSLWQELGRYFPDPRLRQLFGRYATYCGSSPFAAPATLMLVAHVEREAVWRVEGGLFRVAAALALAAQRQGARLRHGCEVAKLQVEGGRIQGVALADGQHLPADFVVFNGDARALCEGLLDPPVARSLGVAHPATPSLSALTWHVEADTAGFALSHHNVFFGPPQAYRDEFAAIAAGRLPENPTVYLCAQDRSGAVDLSEPLPPQPERLMLLVNAPARPLEPQEIARCETQMWQQLERSGLRLTPRSAALQTRPQDFARLFPGSQGALYGPANQGWQASFRSRPAVRTALPGLFLAGGSVHPGPGVPMASLSGQLAATQILADLASTWRSHPVATPGGMSTR